MKRLFRFFVLMLLWLGVINSFLLGIVLLIASRPPKNSLDLIAGTHSKLAAITPLFASIIVGSQLFLAVRRGHDPLAISIGPGTNWLWPKQRK